MIWPERKKTMDNVLSKHVQNLSDVYSKPTTRFIIWSGSVFVIGFGACVAFYPTLRQLGVGDRGEPESKAVVYNCVTPDITQVDSNYHDRMSKIQENLKNIREQSLGKSLFTEEKSNYNNIIAQLEKEADKERKFYLEIVGSIQRFCDN